MNNIRLPYLPVLVIFLGVLACIGWLHIGHVDDAPGAGMIGIAALVTSLVAAIRLYRARRARP